MNPRSSEVPSAGTFRVERRSDGVAVVWIDVEGRDVNTLPSSFAPELAAVFDGLSSDPQVRAVVVASGKRESFLAGLDLGAVMRIKSAPIAEKLARESQQALAHVLEMRKPVVAAIHGACLGIGLELALVCHARVATWAACTRLGLPEVQLGLLPAAGGTQRLPRLIRLEDALDLLLTGNSISAAHASRLGLVDDVVPAPLLLASAAELALRLTRESRVRRRRSEPRRRRRLVRELRSFAFEGNPIGRRFFFEQTKKSLLEKTRGNYPAPERILDVVRRGLEEGMAIGLEAEARAFGELSMSAEAAELIHLFVAQKERSPDRTKAEPRLPTRIGVLGAGAMGSEIACVTAEIAKLPVRLKDRDHESLARGMKSIARILDGKVAQGRLTREEAERTRHRIGPTTSDRGFERCELVIEAVPEELGLKRRVLREAEAIGPSDVIFATNASAIPIAELAAASKHPETVIGMHYLSPAHRIPLVEIVVTDRTAPWVTATCLALAEKQGKTAIVVRDGVGFYTTRILAAFVNEAMFALTEGAPIEEIDRALVDFGFPVGPIKLIDEVGIDVATQAITLLHRAFGARMAPAPGIESLLADQRRGRKNHRGFYRYGRERGVDESVYGTLGVTPRPGDHPSHALAWRCTLAMVNEAARCLGEGVLRSARDGNIGAVFGLGFPAFRGGPFRFLDRIGPRPIVDRLERLRAAHGSRFEPAPLLVEAARDGVFFSPMKLAGPRKVHPTPRRAEIASAR